MLRMVCGKISSRSTESYLSLIKINHIVPEQTRREGGLSDLYSYSCLCKGGAPCLPRSAPVCTVEIMFAVMSELMSVYRNGISLASLRSARSAAVCIVEITFAFMFVLMCVRGGTSLAARRSCSCVSVVVSTRR